MIYQLSFLKNMREGAPIPEEQGSYTDFDGSVESGIKHARIKAAGVQNAMEGIAEAVGVAKTLEGLGNLAQKFPEFRYWVERALEDAEELARLSKKKKVTTHEIARWKKDIDSAIESYKGPREDALFYLTRKEAISSLPVLRALVADARKISGPDLDEEGSLDEVEDAVVWDELNDDVRAKARAIFEKYKKNVPVVFRNLTPGNATRARINESE